MAERFPQRNTKKGSSTFSVLGGARIHPHLTSLIVMLQMRSQSLKQNNSQGFLCDCPQSKHSTAQNSLISKMSLSWFFFLTFSSFFFCLRMFEACPVQLPPTVPLSASLFPLALSDYLLPWQWKKVQLCGVLWAEWEESAHLIDFPGQSYNLLLPGPNM